MARHLKPIEDQTLVLTGASSGIGLVTARMAAHRGARLVLVARNENALAELADEINNETPGQAVVAPADMADFDKVKAVGRTAREAFGSIDTWINCAAVSIYGNIIEIDLADHRRLFETNYWGYVHGCLVAVEALREQGGVIINVGSVLSDRAIPDQGPYCASKHAVKGFTDSLRMEIEEAGLPISVSLIKPSAIDTPYKDHAKNYFDVKAKNPPPVYAPETVARAILHCAQHPQRDIVVGGGGKVIAALGTQFPRMTDKVMELTMSRLQKTDEAIDPEDRGQSSLYRPMEDGKERGRYPNHVSESSLYTQATMHPIATTAILAGIGLALGTAWHARRAG